MTEDEGTAQQPLLQSLLYILSKTRLWQQAVMEV